MNNSYKILIVDDSDYMRRKIIRVLEAFRCDFFEADDEETALALIRQNNFEVIFLDLRFPFGISGIDILKKAKEIRPELGRVIILTAWIDDLDTQEARELGVFDFLGKAPVDRNKIRETFSRAVARQ